MFLLLPFLLQLSRNTFAQNAQKPLELHSKDSRVTNNNAILTTNVDAFIQEILHSWNSPAGISVAVVRQREDGGWDTETKGYGFAKVDGTRMSEESLVCIASNSKVRFLLQGCPER